MGDDDLIPPGMPPGPANSPEPAIFAGSGRVDPDDVRSILDDSESVLADYRRIESAEIARDLSEISSAANQAHAVIVGGIDVDLDASEGTFVKAYSRAADDVSSSLMTAYQSAINVGLPVPTDDQILIAASTGDPLASLFVRPDSYAGDVSSNADMSMSGSSGDTGGFRADDDPRFPQSPMIPPSPIGGGIVGGDGCSSEDVQQWYMPYSRTHQLLRSETHPGHPQAIQMPGCPYWAIPHTPPPPPPPPPPDHYPLPVPPPGGGNQIPPLPSGGTVCAPPPDDPEKEQCLTRWIARLYAPAKTMSDITPAQQQVVTDICACFSSDPDSKRPPDPTKPPDGKIFGRERQPLGQFPVKVPKWCRSDISSQIDAFIRSSYMTPEDVSKSLGIAKDKDGKYKVAPWSTWIAEASGLPWYFHDLLVGLVDGLVHGAFRAAEVVSDPTETNSRPSIVADALLGIFELMHKVTGFPPGSWVRRMEKLVNRLAPEGIPTPDEARRGYLNGAWDIDTARAYIGAGNQCIEPQEKMIRSERNRQNVNDLVTSRYRGLINESTYDKLMSEIGVIEPSERKLFLDLFSQLPGMSDIIRFLVRDVDDPDVVRDYRLDDEFAKKWGKNLSQYAKQQGISEDLARMYWRAHWEFPSPTQLYTMLHRLRPGRVHDNLVVDRKLVEKTLGINDYSPYWQGRLTEISYSPLTRTDVQRAYFIGALSRGDVKEAYLDGGYDEENAEKLTKFTERLKWQRDAKTSGAPTPKTYISQFSRGSLSRGNASAGLRQWGWTWDQIATTLDSIVDNRDETIKQKKWSRIRKDFMRFRIDSGEATAQLVQSGQDVDSANFSVETWHAERGTGHKLIASGQLCQMHTRGLISTDQYSRSLAAAGYSADDVQRVIGLCDAQLSERQMKELAREIEAARKRSEKFLEDGRKEREKQQKEREKKQKEAEKKEKERKKEDEKKEKERAKNDPKGDGGRQDDPNKN